MTYRLSSPRIHLANNHADYQYTCIESAYVIHLEYLISYLLLLLLLPDTECTDGIDTIGLLNTWLLAYLGSVENVMVNMVVAKKRY